MDTPGLRGVAVQIPWTAAGPATASPRSRAPAALSVRQGLGWGGGCTALEISGYILQCFPEAAALDLELPPSV
eukprot:4185061-Prymnesium_polylepis.1